MAQRLFILDAPGYVYRAYHALPYLSTSRGLPSHVMLGASTMVWKLLREESPDYFVAAAFHRGVHMQLYRIDVPRGVFEPRRRPRR